MRQSNEYIREGTTFPTASVCNYHQVTLNPLFKKDKEERMKLLALSVLLMLACAAFGKAVNEAPAVQEEESISLLYYMIAA